MKKSVCWRYVFFCILFFCNLFFDSSALANAPRGNIHAGRAYVPGRLLIQVNTQAEQQLAGTLTPQRMASGQTGLAGLDALNDLYGVRRIYHIHQELKRPRLAEPLGANRWYILEVSETEDITALAQSYRENEHIQTAKPDWLLFRAVAPNDERYPSQWGHHNSGQMLDYCWDCGGHDNGRPVGTPGVDADAQSAWDQSQGYGSADVVIAIIDTGVDTTHADLNLIDGYDFGDDDNDPNDDSAVAGHGTACAGVAAATADNTRGVAGIAGGCSIMPLKTADHQGAITTSSLTKAIYYAADNNADIISISLGAALTSDEQVDPALQYAYQAGVLLLAAAGNENADAILHPANNPNVMAIGAASPCGDRKRSSRDDVDVDGGVRTDPNGYTCDGERWWGSNYGPDVQDDDGAIDLLAPTILPTTDIGGSEGYDSGDYFMWFNGTSCATPYAAGVAALIKAQNPLWTPSQIRERMVATATDIQNVESDVGWDRYSGYGLVNAGAALAIHTHISEESESNDDDASADGPVGSDQAVRGYCDRNDTDWFYFDVQRPDTLQIILHVGDSADLDWFLYDANLQQVARGYTLDNPEVGTYYAGNAGRYYLEVNGYRDAIGPYNLTVRGNLLSNKDVVNDKNTCRR